MRFGKSAAEAAEEPNRGGAGGEWIKYLKDGDTTFRILQDKDNGWSYFWEHFSPAGFSFACNGEEDCPGCTSDNERMSKVTRKVAFNVLQSVNGVEYVNVYKVPQAVASKLENRINRFGTVTDRDYTITRYKTPGDRYDYDVEGGMPTPIDVSKYELKNIEQMLAEQWDEQWGNPDQAAANRQAEKVEEPAPRRPMIAATPKQEEPPFEPEYREEVLRAMSYEDLVALVKSSMDLTPPAGITTSDGVVDWLMSIQP